MTDRQKRRREARETAKRKLRMPGASLLQRVWQFFSHDYRVATYGVLLAAVLAGATYMGFNKHERVREIRDESVADLVPWLTRTDRTLKTRACTSLETRSAVRRVLVVLDSINNDMTERSVVRGRKLREAYDDNAVDVYLSYVGSIRRLQHHYSALYNATDPAIDPSTLVRRTAAHRDSIARERDLLERARRDLNLVLLPGPPKVYSVDILICGADEEIVSQL
jgi:hypothetical protein